MIPPNRTFVPGRDVVNAALLRRFDPVVSARVEPIEQQPVDDESEEESS